MMIEERGSAWGVGVPSVGEAVVGALCVGSGGRGRGAANPATVASNSGRPARESYKTVTVAVGAALRMIPRQMFTRRIHFTMALFRQRSHGGRRYVDLRRLREGAGEVEKGPWADWSPDWNLHKPSEGGVE